MKYIDMLFNVKKSGYKGLIIFVSCLIIVLVISSILIFKTQPVNN